MSKAMVSGAVDTLDGSGGPSTLVLTLSGSAVSVRDGAISTVQVTQADVPASNGVVHVIDGVLVPESLLEILQTMLLQVSPANRIDIMSLFSAVPQFSTLASLLKAAGLDQEVPKELSTMFAPTNHAFAQMPAELLAFLTHPDNKHALVIVLMYHMLGTKVLKADMRHGALSTLDGGSRLFLTMNASDVWLRAGGMNRARLTQADVIVTNGIVHVINAVLVPVHLLEVSRSYLTAAPTLGVITLVSLLTSLPQFSTLVSLLDAAGLVDGLSKGLWTMFVPTNNVFDKLPENVMQSLIQPENKQTLVRLLEYHVLTEILMSTDMQTGPLNTLDAGSLLFVTVDSTGVKVRDAEP